MQYILMNTEMTKAILDERKTQTRRAITKFYRLSDTKKAIAYIDMPKDLEFKYLKTKGKSSFGLFYSKSQDEWFTSQNINYNTGEKIWVREPAKVVDYIIEEHNDKIKFSYKADNKKNIINIPNRIIKDFDFPKWILNKQGVPNGCIREMARIFLIITNVRVERLRDMELEDYLQEGYLKFFCNKNPLNWFKDTWSKTAQKGYKWEDSPFVYVYEFKRIEQGNTNE